MTKWSDLFTPRQLVALTTFSELVGEARERIRQDALAAGMADEQQGLDAGGTGATAYAEAVSMYLALAVDKLADYNSTLCVMDLWWPNNEEHLWPGKPSRWYGILRKRMLSETRPGVI